jgi:hypothetical protein
MRHVRLTIDNPRACPDVSDGLRPRSSEGTVKLDGQAQTEEQ